MSKQFTSDKELQEFRNIMEVPSKFESGFKLSSFLGACFLALVMIPGSIYMELIAGQTMGSAAQWVTLVLFIEVAKRANRTLSRPEIFILFYISGAIVGQNVHGTPLFTQFLVRSEAAVAQGISDLFPNWVAPQDEEAYIERSFFIWAWAPAIALVAFRMFMTKIDHAVLSYGLFRQTSDVERLPFPMAPMGAQGIMALADDQDNVKDSKVSWRWRVFSIGGALGMIYGFVYLAIPTLSGPLLGQTYAIFPIPFVDYTTYVESYLPTAALGVTFDFSQLVIGMVMPFWAVLGSFIGVLVLVFINPILTQIDGPDGLPILGNKWQEGQSMVETIFSNNVDFYFSFGIGLSVAVALIGLWGAFRRPKNINTDTGKREPVKIPDGRGDIPNSFIIIFYLVSSAIIIGVCGYLIDWHGGVMAVLFFYAFLYTPVISYVTARLEGLAGQIIEIPFIRELSFILSGYNGVAVWFLPIPKANYGIHTLFYRKAELTGTSFTSIWKAEALLFPLIIVSTLVFSSFIWSLAEIPSALYPYTVEIWEFEAKNACLIFTATMGEYSQFDEALSLWKIGAGFGFGLLIYGGLSFFGAPVLLFYGLVKGLSGSMLHLMVTQFIGGLIGRYYFRRKFGNMWLKYISVIAAGFFCGGGLITMFCIGMVFLAGSVSNLPF